MTSKAERAGRRPVPSSVACPGSHAAQPAGASPEPVPGLRDYLTKRLRLLENRRQECLHRVKDKRVSAHTSRQWTRIVDSSGEEIHTLYGLLRVYGELCHAQ